MLTTAKRLKPCRRAEEVRVSEPQWRAARLLPDVYRERVRRRPIEREGDRGRLSR